MTQQQVSPVGKGGERRRIPGQDLQPVFPEPKLPDDLGQEEADHVGHGRGLETRQELFGRRASAQGKAALQHTDLASGPGQVGRGHQPVMTAANDHTIVLCHGAFLILAPPSQRSSEDTTGYGRRPVGRSSANEDLIDSN